ncbi:MAG: TIGR02996 domain-containing protein [Gemmataceae bacterium]|nr:TIGR02996 domain-containing protein [Gemmataceae bacterium]
MIHDEGFLHAIGERPDDDGLRLVYADWLDEHGDLDYAEFIRVQVMLAQNADGKGDVPPSELARLRSRERSLLSRNKTRWLQPLRDLGARGRVHGEFWRGFVEDPVIDAAVFLERGEELFRISPVVTLHLNKVGRLARRLSHCPLLARVRRLAFEGTDSITPKALRTILEAEHFAKLESLHLWILGLSDADLLDLAAVPVLPSLLRLSMWETSITGATLPALVARFDRLECLGLPYNRRFDPRRFADILAALNPTSLRSLSFDQTRLETLGMRGLAEAKRFTAMEELWLRECAFDVESMRAFAEATHLTAVKKLYLGGNTLSDEGGIALATWSGLRSLHALNLNRCGVLSGGGEALARALSSGSLVELELLGNSIGDAGAYALASGGLLVKLHTLDLSGNDITAEGIRPLADSPQSGKLRYLALDGNRIGDEGSAILAESPHLRSLRWLTLQQNGISQQAARRLVVQLPNLTVFVADGGLLTEEHLEPLREALVAGGSEDAVNAAVETRLVQAMLDDPNDMEARKLYARFLQDIHSPWSVVIRLQYPDQDAPTEVERWRSWFEAGRNDWLAPLLPWAQLFDDSESFDRGFLRKVHFARPLPDEVAEALTRFPPLAFLPLEVQRGHMTGEGAFQVFARRSCLSRMPHLDFRAITARELRHVLDSPHLTTLEELSFGHCRLDDEVARLLAASPKTARLRSLDFGRGDEEATPEVRNQIGPAGLAGLGRSPHLSRLRSLGLQGNVIGDAGVEVLLSAPSLGGLIGLDLRSTGLSDAGVRRLAESPHVASLKMLRLGGDAILGDDAVQSLVRSPHLVELYELELGLSDEGARILAASPHFTNLQALRVNAGVTDSGRELLRKRFGSRLC